MAIVIGNDVNSPQFVYDEVLQLLIQKGGSEQAKDLIRNHLMKVFAKNVTNVWGDTITKDNSFVNSMKSNILLADLVSNFSVSKYFIEQGVKGVTDKKGDELPDVKQRTFDGTTTALSDFVKNVSRDNSYKDFLELITIPFEIYFDSESREFTSRAVPMKSILVGTLEVNMNSKKLSGVAKAIYSYILEQSEENFEDIVDGLYRSLTTKFKNRYKKFVHPDTIVSVDDLLQGTNLPSEMDYDVVVKNPTHLFTTYYSEEEFIVEMGKLYDDNPVALNRMIMGSSRPYQDYEKIRNYIDSKERNREWIIGVFGLNDIPEFIYEYKWILHEILNLPSFLDSDMKLEIINGILPTVPEQGEEFEAYSHKDSIFDLLRDILTEDPGLLDSIENPENIYSRRFIPGFTYINPAYRNNLDDFIKFTNTKSGLFIINDNERMYSYIKSFVSLVGTDYENYSKEFDLSISYDDLVDLFDNRVVKIEDQAKLGRQFWNDWSMSSHIIRLEND